MTPPTIWDHVTSVLGIFGDVIALVMEPPIVYFVAFAIVGGAVGLYRKLRRG